MEPLLQILSGLDDAPPRRLAHTLYSLVVQAVVDGRLAQGLRLPSSRELAHGLGVSRNTVIDVYDRLANEGYAVARQGRGFFITHAGQNPRPRSAVMAGVRYGRHVVERWQGVEQQDLSRDGVVFDLFPGVPDTRSFPAEVWRRLCARAARNHRFGEEAYAETQGREGLRRAIAKHVSLTRAVSCAAADVVVTAGTQGAIDLLCRVLVTPGETTVAIEEPGYVFARQAFEMAGAKVVPVPVDAEGLVVARIPDEVDLIFVAPSHQFPLGHVMSPARRRELIAFAAARGALILEDDYQAEFPVDGKPADALQSLDGDETVFYIGTFSKCMFPELRLGFIVPPRWALAPLLAAKQLSLHENPWLEQDALAAFISEGHLARHIRKMRDVYSAKRDAMVRALRRSCGPWIGDITVDGVAYLTVRLRADKNARTVAGACRARGLRIMPLSVHYAGKADINGFVIGLGRIASGHIDAAVAVLAACLAEQDIADRRIEMRG